MNVIHATTAVLSLTMIVGCVPMKMYSNTLDELEEARRTSAQNTAAFNSFKKKSTAEIEALRQEKAKISKDFTAALTEARDKVKDLESRLATEQVKAGTLREEKQRLMTGTTTAQEEIARIQKRVGELETAAARVDDLEERLRERDHEIAKLRQALIDRETLASRVATLTQERSQLMAELQKLQEAMKARKEQPEAPEGGARTPNPGVGGQRD
jgi:DNA repair exonuclease SbcCD ATPase subunit